VSTGRAGYETPAGIFSILQKRRHHFSNLYNDAAMPFMQRLTWSGIALHAGDLPGYPASHGCIRLPHGFAERLFGLTKRGMRVVVVRDDVAPVEVAHPALFKPAPAQPAPGEEPAPGNVHLSSVGGTQLENAAPAPRPTRRSMVAAKEAAAEAASREVNALKRAVNRLMEEVEEFEEPLYRAERSKLRAAVQLEEAQSLTPESPERAQEIDRIKAEAQQRLASAQAEIDAIYARAQPKVDATRAALQELKAAEAARAAALKEAEIARRPVSVFISRKTRRLYVRRAFQPVFDIEIGIRSPDKPIGTTIFTAMDWTDDEAELVWTALSMRPHRATGASRRPGGEPAETSAEAARAALERISILPDAIARISRLVTPGSSLIVSDEGLSKETGEATDFVVVMSGEPQGGIARRRTALPADRSDDDGTLPWPRPSSFFRWW
jgi:hypothetical protein